MSTIQRFFDQKYLYFHHVCIALPFFFFANAQKSCYVQYGNCVVRVVFDWRMPQDHRVVLPSDGFGMA